MLQILAEALLLATRPAGASRPERHRFPEARHADADSRTAIAKTGQRA